MNWAYTSGFQSQGTYLESPLWQIHNSGLCILAVCIIWLQSHTLDFSEWNLISQMVSIRNVGDSLKRIPKIQQKYN